MRKKVLVLCHDTVGEKMAGPGIRYQNIAEQLKKVSNVTLGVFSNGDGVISGGIKTIKKTGDGFKEVFDKHDVVFAQWISNEMLQYANKTGKIIIIDLYAPVPIEYLASLGFSDKNLTEEDLEFTGVLETYRQYLTHGDYFVCSNERQRDFWVGFITSSNILKPTNFKTYPVLNRIALCPMGISPVEPDTSSLKLRKRLGLAKDDFVLLWTGGIWDWFDAQIVINAIGKLNNPKIKLVFMGTQHPNSEVPEMAESKKARKLSEKLKLTNKSIFFMDGWVDYNDRASYLLDADAAIYADKESVETRFSHRTRVLDHIWVGIPTICSKGDYLSDILEKMNMGIVVQDRTVQGFADAIDMVYKNPQTLTTIKDNIKKQQHLFTWDVLSEDLCNFVKTCDIPSKTIDQQGYIEKPVAPKKSLTKKTARRVKNSVKVLLGRIDV